MDVLQHCHLSQRKFGGDHLDYVAIHQFLDSTKLYFHHVKHRAVLHNLFGVELAVEIFGAELFNSSGKTICVRDIAIAHVKEDLSGRIPSLHDWFERARYLADYCPEVPENASAALKEFIARPYLRSGLNFTMFITLSDFGVFLCQKVLGTDTALELRSLLSPRNTLRRPLNQFQFRHEWQFTPDIEELRWLEANGFSNNSSSNGAPKLQGKNDD